jgi:hypothetical protein
MAIAPACGGARAAQQRTLAKRVALTGETPAGRRIDQSSSSS